MKVDNQVKFFIRDYTEMILNREGKVSNLKIWWSRSYETERGWTLEISYKILNPTLRLVRGTDIGCKDTYLAKIKTIISIPKQSYIEWLREAKLDSLIS